MRLFLCVWFPLAALALLAFVRSPRIADACCPAPHFNEPVVNADQTVLMIWDSAAKRQHFIRQASFKSKGDDFGFLVPSPAEPELTEADDHIFVRLAKLTEPETIKARRPAPNISCGCASSAPQGALSEVRVLQEKLVAGYRAVVLEAGSSNALAEWLKENDLAYSPEVKEWAEPYVKANWKFTALRLAKRDDSKTSRDVAASALRISFKTDKPLFPYREPDSKASASALEANRRMLRIFFVADARYKGAFPDGTPWQAKVPWANSVPDDVRKTFLEMLKLPDSTGPAGWYLTEFEHDWPYAKARGDVYFSRDGDQTPVKRLPWVEYTSSPNRPDIAGLVAPPA